MQDPDRHLIDGDFAPLFALLDHPTPRVDAARIIARVRRNRTRRSAMLAAAALLGAATIATAAVPGTALNDLVGSLLGRGSTTIVRPSRASSAPPEPRSAAAAPLGIAFIPGDRATIVFRADQPSGELYVRVDTTSSVKITATGGDARYDLTPAGVEIDNAGSTASYEIVFPTALAHATVRANERVVVSKERSALVCGARRVSTGSCVVALQP